MKSEGVRVSLCCPHCHERVGIRDHAFYCGHCGEACEANTDVAGALMKIAEAIQAMTSAELDEMLSKEPKETCYKCNGRAFRTSKVPDGKRGIGTVESVCRTCDGAGKV